MKNTLLFVMIFSVMLFSAAEYQYAEVKISSLEDLKFLHNNNIDIDRTSIGDKGSVAGGAVTVYITEEQFYMLEKSGYSLKWAPLQLPDKLTDFRHNTAIGDSMLIWQNRYPSICKRIQIGTSVQSRPLWVLKISDNVDIEEAEPEVKFVSTMHGDEVTGVEMEMFFIENILRGYAAANDTMQFIVNNTELYVMPLMNPDGMENNSRYNANGLDLNRNFPDFLTGDPNSVSASQLPEIAAMIDFSNEHNFILSTNYHGGALVANYILDTMPPLVSGQYAAAPDDLHAVWLASNYAVRNLPMYNGAFTDGITNGLEWYEAVGGMQDWNYHYYGDMDMTLEISDTKWPSYSTIPGFWADNREAMFWYISAAHKGIYGVVTDADTGYPLDATIEIAGIDKEYYTDPDFGDYYRVLKPGTYSLTVSAPGYVSQTINNITVTDNTGKFKEATEVNVQLQKAPRPDITLSQTDTLRISAAPASTGQAQFSIGNIDTEDLVYSMSVNYRQSKDVKGSGGPDTFGYTWKDSDEPDGPVFNWVDITLLGTPLGLSDDGMSSAINMGINFNYYGTDHQTVLIGANGAVTFNAGSISYTNTIMPNSSAPNAVIAPFWDDLNPGSSTSDDIYYYSDTANGRFIIQYNEIINYGGNSKNTFEIILNENGSIVFQYLTMNGTLNSCTVGIEDSAGTDGLQLVYNSSYIKNGLAVIFEPNLLPQWLTLDPVSGTVEQSGSDVITATASSEGLDYGSYYAEIVISSNDPDESVLYLPVKFTVSDVLSSPLNLIVVSAGSAQADLGWDAVSGATLYHIYRSTEPYAGFTEIGTSATNSYTDTGVLSGNKYFYYVTADNAK